MHHVSKHIIIIKNYLQICFIGCGHCKNIKPELIQASIDLHEQQVEYRIFLYNFLENKKKI